MQCTLDGFLQLTLSVHQRAEDLGERVMETHGNFAGGDGHLPEALGQMRAVAFEHSRAEGSPDQSLGDVGFGGIKGGPRRSWRALVRNTAASRPVSRATRSQP